MNVLMDASPVAPRLPRRKLRVPAPPTPGVLTSLTNHVVDTYSDFVKRILDGYVNVANVAERLAASAKQVRAIEAGLNSALGQSMRETMARWIVDSVVPVNRLVPKAYANWRSPVRDAVMFVVAHLSPARLGQPASRHVQKSAAPASARGQLQARAENDRRSQSRAVPV